MIHRIYTKVNSAEEFEALKRNANASNVQWWNDSRCHYSLVADVGMFITEVFLDTDPTATVEYPQLVCAEVQY